MRKGVSNIYAIILLVAIAVSLISLSYNSITSIVNEISSGQSRAIKHTLTLGGTRISLEEVGPCKVYLRNIGTQDIPIDSLAFYINNVPVEWVASDNVLEKNKVVEINLTPQFEVREGKLGILVGDTIKELATISCFMPILCSIKNNCNQAAGEVCVLTLSALNNAHAGNCSTNYPYKLCCTNVSVSYSTSSCPNGQEGIITLSNDQNAQVEEYGLPTGFSVKKNICLTPNQGNLDCITNTTNDCLSNGYILLFSISGETNAHIGNYNAYSKVVCCRII